MEPGASACLFLGFLWVIRVWEITPACWALIPDTACASRSNRPSLSGGMLCTCAAWGCGANSDPPLAGSATCQVIGGDQSVKKKKELRKWGSAVSGTDLPSPCPHPAASSCHPRRICPALSLSALRDRAGLPGSAAGPHHCWLRTPLLSSPGMLESGSCLWQFWSYPPSEGLMNMVGKGCSLAEEGTAGAPATISLSREIA